MKRQQQNKKQTETANNKKVKYKNGYVNYYIAYTEVKIHYNQCFTFYILASRTSIKS